MELEQANRATKQKLLHLVDDVWDSIKNPFRKIRNFYYDITIGISNIITYAPIVYRDRDFDYCYTLEMLRFKLERQRKCIKEDQYFASVNDAKLIKELTIAIELLKRIIEDDYATEAHTKLVREWWESREETENERGDVMMSFPINTELTKVLRKSREKESARREADFSFFWDHMQKHIRRWWT